MGFLRRQKRSIKSDQKQNLFQFFPSFFSHHHINRPPVGVCDASLPMKETLQISFDFCFSNTNAGSERSSRPARDGCCGVKARTDVLPVHFGVRCARLTASKGRFLGRMRGTRRCGCAFLVRFLVAVFSPFEEDTHFGRNKKKNRNPVGKRPARKRHERTFLTVVFFGAAVFFFVAAAALICKANAIFVFDIRGVNAKACEI